MTPSSAGGVHTRPVLRTDLVLLAGHYGRRWFAVGVAGYDRAWLTYVKNSDDYRTNFYATLGANDRF